MEMFGVMFSFVQKNFFVRLHYTGFYGTWPSLRVLVDNKASIFPHCDFSSYRPLFKQRFFWTHFIYIFLF